MTARPASRAMLAKIHAMLPKAGVTDQETKLAYYREVTCRPEVTSGNDLTFHEAGWVVDDLERVERGETNFLSRVTGGAS